MDNFISGFSCEGQTRGARYFCDEILCRDPFAQTCRTCLYNALQSHTLRAHSQVFAQHNKLSVFTPHGGGGNWQLLLIEIRWESSN